MPKIDGRTLSHEALEHMRRLAVRRVVEDGERPSEVMVSLGLCRTSIYPWLRRYKDQGLEALVEKIAQGPEPKLSDKQRQQVRRWIGRRPRSTRHREVSHSSQRFPLICRRFWGSRQQPDFPHRFRLMSIPPRTWEWWRMRIPTSPSSWMSIQTSLGQTPGRASWRGKCRRA